MQDIFPLHSRDHWRSNGEIEWCELCEEEEQESLMGPCLPYALRTLCSSGDSREREFVCAAADEIERLRRALGIARTALLKIERRCEEGRAEISEMAAGN